MKYERQLEPLLEKLLPKVNPLGAAMITTTLNFTMAKGSDGPRCDSQGALSIYR